MEFNEMLISTGVDALIKLVREKGKVEITLASRFLNIPISTIEEWSHALESEGIISIEYQLTKVYLRWISPTNERIEQERAALESERTILLQEIKERGKKAEEQAKEVSAFKDEFIANYSKIIAKLEQFEKTGSSGQQLKGIREDEYYKLVDGLSELRGKISELNDSIKFMHEQLEKISIEFKSADIEKKMHSVIESKENIAILKKELEGMEKEASKSLDALLTRSTDVSSIKKSMDKINEDYHSLKTEIDNEITALKEANSAAELLTNTKKEMTALRTSTEKIFGEISKTKGTVLEIEEKISKFSTALNENEQKTQNLIEAIKIAEETFDNFQINEKTGSKIEKLVERGTALETRMDKFQNNIQQVFPVFESADAIISSLSELKKKISEERKRLAEESGAIFASLDQEVATYSTFQKIKERALVMMSDYRNQLERIEADYENVGKNTEKLSQKLDETLQKFRETPEYKDIEQASSAIDELLEKKRMLEEVKARLDALDVSATKTLKHVKLLAKEAELLEIKASSTLTEEREEARTSAKEIRGGVSLTETEQKDFDEKREELKKLIKKLWEED